MHLLLILLACDDGRQDACDAARAAEMAAWNAVESSTRQLVELADTEVTTHADDLAKAKEVARQATFRFEDARVPLKKYRTDLDRRCTGIMGCFDEAVGQAEAVSRGEAVDPHPRLVDVVDKLGRALADARAAEQARVEANFAFSSIQDLHTRAKRRQEDLVAWQWKVDELTAAAGRGSDQLDVILKRVDELATDLWPTDPPLEVAAAMEAHAVTTEACAGLPPAGAE